MTNPFKFLRAATPYVRALRGKVFVVKVGGDLLTKPEVRRHIYDQLALLHNFGIHIVLIHGGGPQIEAECKRKGLEIEKVNGRRVTTDEVLETVKMVLPGSLQAGMLAEMRSLGLPAVGISGIAADLVVAAKRPPVSVTQGGNESEVDYGAVGDVTGINPEVLTHLIAGGFLPVVAPLGCDSSGAVFNINADTIAAEIAKAIGAEKLVFLLTARGILNEVSNPSSLIPELSMEGLDELEQRGVLKGGMLPKATATKLAISGGVTSVHLLSGTQTDALLQEIFTNEGSGTMVVKNV